MRMYGKEITKVFDEKGIKIWDTVRIEKSGIYYEGIVMPRTEAGDENTLVVKQKDGYNIGIGIKGAKIEKIASSGQKPEPTLPKKRVSPGLSKVSLLYTGGTIGNKVDYKTGGVYALTKPEELLDEVPELAGIANIDPQKISSVASEDMTSSNWAKIASEAARALNSGSKGIIVTIGTDTMHYAAAALSFMLEGLTGPVVLTGAQRSSDRGSSDAFQNLICSAHIAAKSDIAEVGICMHSTSSDGKCSFIRGTKVRKMHTSRRDAFKPVNSKPIAYVDVNGEIQYGSGYSRTGGSSKVEARTGFDEKVALIKAYPGSDPGIIDYYTGKDYKGIILEGTGLGHVPNFTEDRAKSWLPEVTDAINSGVIVGMTSQCLYGRVNPNVYRTLRMLSAAGVVYCEDMLPEVAYVKLGWLLGNFKADIAKEKLNKNLAGEITGRTLYEEFTD